MVAQRLEGDVDLSGGNLGFIELDLHPAKVNVNLKVCDAWEPVFQRFNFQDTASAMEVGDMDRRLHVISP
jgi:hypothetical protein